MLRAGALALVPAAVVSAGAWSEREVVPRPANSFAIRGVRVFDGERVTEADTVYVENGTIAAIGRGIPVPAEVTVHDGSGRTVLPGLIDAHVHTSPDTARHGPRFGITTMLDMFTLTSLLPEFRRIRQDRHNANTADVWTAGTMITAPGGHGTQYGEAIPTLGPDVDAADFVHARLAEGSDFIKITYEDGSAFGRQIPTLTAEQLKAVVIAAHNRGIRVAVHASTAAGAALAVAAGADVLAHVPTDPLAPAVIDSMSAQGTAVVATLVVIAAGSCTDDAASLAGDPRIAPYLTEDQLTLLARPFSQCAPPHLGHALANVAALRRAGVPILAGSDSGNPGTAYGASLLGELSLLVRAGLSPTEALNAATALPASRFSLADRGRLAPGLRADLVLVDGDPTVEVAATRNIVTVWKNGFPVSRSPGPGAAS